MFSIRFDDTHLALSIHTALLPGCVFKSEFSTGAKSKALEVYHAIKPGHPKEVDIKKVILGNGRSFIDQNTVLN